MNRQVDLITHLNYSTPRIRTIGFIRFCAVISARIPAVSQPDSPAKKKKSHICPAEYPRTIYTAINIPVTHPSTRTGRYNGIINLLRYSLERTELYLLSHIRIVRTAAFVFRLP